MKCLLLVSILAVASCRPQGVEQSTKPSSDEQPVQPDDHPVQVEKQELLEIHPEARQLPRPKTEVPEESDEAVEERTKQILEKIAEVNKKQGLVPKKRRPDYFHFPFSYSRSQASDQERSDGFKFPNSPFVNPIFEYLEKQNREEDNQNFGNRVRFVTHLTDGQNEDADDNDTEVPPGHYIKRKIVHKQTFLVPLSANQYMMPGTMASPFPTIAPIGGPSLGNPVQNFGNTKFKEYEKNQSLNSLEKETVENIKNIVLNSQMSQMIPVHLNPYNQQMQFPYPLQNPYAAQNTPSNQNSFPMQNPYSQNYFGNYPNLDPSLGYPGEYNYPLYGPFVVPDNQVSARQQQYPWPWASLFPIVIKDPMVQMMNAITSMIEYGPSSGGGGASCKHAETKDIGRTGKKLNTDTLVYEIKNENTAPEIIITGSSESLEQNVTTLDIEDLEIKADNEDPTKVTLGFKAWKTTETRKGKLSGDVSTKVNIFNVTKDQSRSSSKTSKVTPNAKNNDEPRISLLGRPTPFSTRPTTTTKPHMWLPIRDKPMFQDEKEQAAEVDKAEDLVVQSHDGNKKLFSKDNTGSGIFIHKLKVRKGGVAIAGPGGIATAGSGGTAIVGPHGVAYTHPDSLAIAGSGTKVVAVDPTINLGDLVNRPIRKDGNTPRVGKVVAVGPVIYYNRG